eukprot:TRINITY_DN1791_c0_g2_i1.p1 TRINITY_DN1791_c0_g2~~TRINITY_DN1791_c0_g2_i1.p1  ORF type:complete len:691 (+),score=189.04 TRINITY_DN1791_c0_g2_i1:56-2128(+)
MQVTKTRVFIFYGGKGKPLFVPQTPTFTFNDFTTKAKELFPGLTPSQVVHFIDEKKQLTTNFNDFEKDMMLYLHLGPAPSTSPAQNITSSNITNNNNNSTQSIKTNSNNNSNQSNATNSTNVTLQPQSQPQAQSNNLVTSTSSTPAYRLVTPPTNETDRERRQRLQREASEQREYQNHLQTLATSERIREQMRNNSLNPYNNNNTTSFEYHEFIRKQEEEAEKEAEEERRVRNLKENRELTEKILSDKFKFYDPSWSETIQTLKEEVAEKDIKIFLFYGGSNSNSNSNSNNNSNNNNNKEGGGKQSALNKVITIKQNCPTFGIKQLKEKIVEVFGKNFGINETGDLVLLQAGGGVLNTIRNVVNEDLILVLKRGDSIGEKGQKMMEMETQRKAKEGEVVQKQKEEQRRILQQIKNKLEEEEKQEESKEEKEPKKITNEERERLKAAEREEIECSICLGDILRRDMMIIEDCCHRFCSECFCNYLVSSISNSEIAAYPQDRSSKTFKASKTKGKRAMEYGVKCPEGGCNKLIKYHEAQRYLTPKDFEKYDEKLRNKVIESELLQGSEDKMMYCLTKGCENLIAKPVKNSREGLLVVCFACKSSFCGGCENVWHEGMSCAEYRDRGKSDELYAKWTAQNTKGCPSCNTRIEKNGGCNHMTCGQCGHQFCWLCLGNYDSGNHFRVTKCRQFSY